MRRERNIWKLLVIDSVVELMYFVEFIEELKGFWLVIIVIYREGGGEGKRGEDEKWIFRMVFILSVILMIVFF